MQSTYLLTELKKWNTEIDKLEPAVSDTTRQLFEKLQKTLTCLRQDLDLLPTIECPRELSRAKHELENTLYVVGMDLNLLRKQLSV